MKTLILGNTSVGKTSYLLKLAQNEAFAGNRVRFITSESHNYIINLLPNNRKFHPLDNIEVETSVNEFRPEPSSFFFINTLIIDNIHNYVDPFDENKVYNFLNPLMRIQGLNVYISSVLKPNHSDDGNFYNIAGSPYLTSTCDKIMILNGSTEDGLRLDIVKDKFGLPRTYPITFGMI